mgnify:CR=1 FL=1
MNGNRKIVIPSSLRQVPKENKKKNKKPLHLGSGGPLTVYFAIPERVAKVRNQTIDQGRSFHCLGDVGGNGMVNRLWQGNEIISSKPLA